MSILGLQIAKACGEICVAGSWVATAVIRLFGLRGSVVGL